MAAARGPIAAPSPSISSLEIHGDDDAADGMYSRQYSLEEENLGVGKLATLIYC